MAGEQECEALIVGEELGPRNLTGRLRQNQRCVHPLGSLGVDPGFCLVRAAVTEHLRKEPTFRPSHQLTPPQLKHLSFYVGVRS